MPNISDVLAQAEDAGNRRTATVSLLLRQDLARRHADLEADLAKAVEEDNTQNRTPLAPGIAQQIVDLEAEMDAAKVTFVFRAVSRRQWVDMLAAHPPTKEQLKAIAATSTDPLRRPSLEFNPDTFPVAVIAAACHDPAMTAEDAERLANSLTDSQFSSLWEAAVKVNVGSTDPKHSRAAAGMIRRMSEQSGTIAAREESDAPTS